MIHYIVKFPEIAAITAAASGVAFNLLCLWSAASFLQGRKTLSEATRASQFTPPISVLKPLKGVDPGMYDSFRSFCLQQYPAYEIIFGVTDFNDPAVMFVDQLKAEFPSHEIRMIVCGKDVGANVKVSSLAQMVSSAKHDYFFVTDSDIRVGPNYLSKVAYPLNDTKVGLVTCLYRGVPAPSLGSQLEALGISTDFVPGVLAAQVVESGIAFGLGSTLAFRRSDLVAIGGFESLADYLADDYELGKRIADSGLKVELSDEVVETFLPGYSFPAFIEHQLRWSRTVRASRPWGFAGLIFTFALPWSILAVFLSAGASWAWGLLGFSLLLRIAVDYAVGVRILEDRSALGSAWAIPLRDTIALVVWATSFLSNSIVWRGERFTLSQGKLVKR